MKTFKDLEFVPQDAGRGIRARIQFDNGFGLSVIHSPYAYCDENTYEVAILEDDEICYDTPLSDGDVLPYKTEEEITKIMEEMQDAKFLKKVTKFRINNTIKEMLNNTEQIIQLVKLL